MAIALTGWFYADAISQKLANAAAITPGQLQDQYHNQLQVLEQFSSVKLGTIALFWAGLGVAMYILSLAVGNSFRSFNNAVVIQTQYTQKPPLWRLVLLPLFKLVAAMVLIGLFAFSGLVLLPALLGTAGAVLLHGLTVAALVSTTLSVIAMAVIMYVLIVAVQLFFVL